MCDFFPSFLQHTLGNVSMLPQTFSSAHSLNIFILSTDGTLHCQWLRLAGTTGFLFSRPGWSKTHSTCEVSSFPWCLNGTVLLFLGGVKQKVSLLWKDNFRLKQLLKFSLGGNRIENWFRTVHEFWNSTVENVSRKCLPFEKLCILKQCLI